MREQHGYPAPTSTRSRAPVASLDHAYDYEEPRTNTTTRRYVGQASPRAVVRFTTHQGPPIQRASLLQPKTEQPQPVAARTSAHMSRHWLFSAGIGLFLMLFGWILLSVVGQWWSGVQDDWQYGYPRTAHYDENVGHGGISHFTVENLGGHILIIEIPANPAQAKIYVGPTLAGSGADLAPATLTFPDVNGDGLPDMILTVDHTNYTFLNSKEGFHALNQQGSVAMNIEVNRETTMLIVCKKPALNSLVDELDDWKEEGAKVIMYGVTEKAHDGFLLLRWLKPIPVHVREKMRKDEAILDYFVLANTFTTAAILIPHE